MKFLNKLCLQQIVTFFVVTLLLTQAIQSQPCPKDQTYNLEENRDKYPMGENWKWTEDNCFVLYHSRRAYDNEQYRGDQLPYFGRYGPTTKHWVTGADIYPEDGWVFINGDFGQDIGSNITPYLLFYNKHTAVLRFFFYYTGGDEHSNAIVEMRFNENDNLVTSGLLATEMDTCKYIDDDYEKVVSETVKIKDLNWSHVDFNVRGWDDRIKNGKFSQLEFDIFGVDLSKIDLKGDINLEQSTIGASGKGLLAKIEEVGKASQATFKTIKDINKYLKITEDPLASAFPYVGAYAKMISGFSSGGTSTQKIKLTGKIGLSGTIKKTITISEGEILVDLPGSKYTSNVLRNSKYNKPLGLFRIKHRPKIQMNRILSSKYGKPGMFGRGLTVFHKKDLMKIIEPIIIEINDESEMYLKFGRVAFVPYDTTNKTIENIIEEDAIKEWEWMPISRTPSYISEIKGIYSYTGTRSFGTANTGQIKEGEIAERIWKDEHIKPKIELKKPVLVLQLVFSLKKHNPNIKDIEWQGIYIPEYEETDKLRHPNIVHPKPLNILKDELWLKADGNAIFHLTEGEYFYNGDITLGKNFRSPVTLRAISKPDSPYDRKPIAYLGKLYKKVSTEND